MALVTCKECKAQVSNKAKTCPSCGAKVPKTSLLGVVIIVILGFWIIGNLTKLSDPSSLPATSNLPTPIIVPSSSKPVWVYNESEDKMRGKSTKYATLDSLNKLNFDFPYSGGSTATIIFRESPKHGKDAMLSISKGQFVCGFEGCSIKAKFDNGPIETFSASESDDGTTTVLFIDNYSKFLTKIKKAKMVTLEAPFYQAGSQQIEFNTEGLNWK